MTVGFNFFDEFNHFVNVFSCLTCNIRAKNVKSVYVVKKCISIEFCNIHYSLVLFFCCFYHFIFAVITVASKVSNVCNIHDMFFVVPKECKGSVKSVKENVCPQISNMCIVVNSRSTAVKTNKAFFNWFEFFYFVTHCVVKF